MLATLFARTLHASTLICLLPIGAAAISQAQEVPAVPASAFQTAAVELPTGLPDAPSSVSSSLDTGDGQSASQPSAQARNTQPKRIFFIIPNYRSVSAGVHLPPQSVKGKFITASQDTFDYSALALAVLVSVERYGTDATPEFGTGGVAYGRYLWHSYADQAVENYSVEFIVPALTHEDTRYYTLGQGSVGHRLVYAVTRAFVTRSDDGHETFNAGEIVGAGVAAGISNLYYPSAERTVGNTLDNYGTNVAIDAASFVLREFDQDIYRKFARKHGPATP
jgi:hypothetical protein